MRDWQIQRVVAQPLNIDEVDTSDRECVTVGDVISTLATYLEQSLLVKKGEDGMLYTFLGTKTFRMRVENWHGNKFRMVWMLVPTGTDQGELLDKQEELLEK